MVRHKIWRLGLLIGILALLVTPLTATVARADTLPGTPKDAGVIGEDWHLQAGETYNGDVAVMGGDAYVEQGAVLNGDLAVMGGNATIRGTVNGDVAVVGGNVEVKDNGVVRGDVLVTGGKVHRDPTAVITGEVDEAAIFNAPKFFNTPMWRSLFQGKVETAHVPPPGSPEWILYYLWRLITGVVGALVTSFVVGAIAAVIESVWPRPTTNVMYTVERAPVANFFIGLAVLIAIAILSVLLIITLCLSPFGALLLLGLIAAWLLGWTAISHIVGQRLWKALNLDMDNKVLPTAAGAFALTLLSSIPCIGHLFGLIIGSVGLGAVVLSSFGTHVPDLGHPANTTSALPPTVGNEAADG